MKLAMAQLQMSESIQENLDKTIRCIHQARQSDADIIMFPEVQLSPFFPQYEKGDAKRWAMTLDGPEVAAMRKACKENRVFACPNIYLKHKDRYYDASLMLGGAGELLGVSKMVNICQVRHFFERDYYTPSEEGFRVYSTPFGRVGIVICFDRHLPESVRWCAKKGARLILIPTANVLSEPLELFEWEMRVQAFQNTAFIAMCNRVGQEGEINFAGQSLVAAPDGSLLFKAGGGEELLLLEIPMEQADQERSARPWLQLCTG